MAAMPVGAGPPGLGWNRSPPRSGGRPGGAQSSSSRARCCRPAGARSPPRCAPRAWETRRASPTTIRSPGFANCHKVLSEGRWSGLALAERLLALLVAAFAPHGPVVVALDGTLERRWGRRIRARGIYRDPVRSSHGHFVTSHGHFVKASGLRWLSLMLVVPIPWARRPWALPFLTVLAPSERSARERGGRHKRLTDWARQALLQAARWLPGRRVVAGTHSGLSPPGGPRPGG